MISVVVIVVIGVVMFSSSSQGEIARIPEGTAQRRTQGAKPAAGRKRLRAALDSENGVTD